MTLQSVCDSTLAINVVMVPEDGETAKRRYKARKIAAMMLGGIRPLPNSCMLT